MILNISVKTTYFFFLTTWYNKNNLRIEKFSWSFFSFSHTNIVLEFNKRSNLTEFYDWKNITRQFKKKSSKKRKWKISHRKYFKILLILRRNNFLFYAFLESLKSFYRTHWKLFFMLINLLPLYLNTSIVDGNKLGIRRNGRNQ